jgi:hypothetical protein
MTVRPHDAPQQLLLFGANEPRTPDLLRARLERGLGQPVDLVLTTNRTSVLTFKQLADRLQVRLQRIFLEAPEDVLDAVVAFVERPAGAARARVIRYFSSRPDAPRRPDRAPPAPPPELARGRFHDLAALYRDLNARYFGGAIAAAITWGAPGHAVRSRHARGRGRSIRFGAYFRERSLIRIHPALDAEWVPRFFVESIVFHEMLHAAVPIEQRADGRRAVHPPEFKRRERAFYAFEEAARWERTNLARLLAARG